MNELLLLLTVVLYFSAPLVAEKLFGKAGLYAWIIIGSIWMNIELTKLVDSFGVEMALGNVLFSSTFLCTDILSEKYGKRDSRTAALLGSFAIVSALVVSQIMLAFQPSAFDVAQGSMETIFTQMPRLAIASFVTYFAVQLHDVWLYHKIWSFTEKRFGKERFLWLRNCGSTIASQALNAIVFNLIAWTGVYSIETIMSITVASFILTAVLALLDTPFVYISRCFVKAPKLAD